MKTTFSVALFGVFSIVLMILVVQWGTGSTESSLVDHEQVGVVLTAPLVKGKITVIKDAQPDSSQSFGFSVEGGPSGNEIDETFSLADPTAAEDATEKTSFGGLRAGTYTLTETETSGYEDPVIDCQVEGTGVSSSSPSGSHAVTVTLAEDEHVICTFSNEQILGSIMIFKDAVPSTGSQTFTFTTTGNGLASFDLTDATDGNDVDDDVTFPDLAAGTYTITEASVTGWALKPLTCGTLPATSSFSQDGQKLTVVLGAGDDVVCTFTNDLRQGSITIVKDADPADDTTFSFTTTGSDLSGFTLKDPAGPSKEFTYLGAGAYTITEGTVSGWDLEDLGCTQTGPTSTVTPDKPNRKVSITLAEESKVTCTFTNEKAQVTPVYPNSPTVAQCLTYLGKTQADVTAGNVLVFDLSGAVSPQAPYYALSTKPVIVIGSSFGDNITGSPFADCLAGGGGGDFIDGYGGGDWIFGGEGDDNLNGSAFDYTGDDHIFGGPGDDRLTGNKGIDYLDGGANTDTCDGGLPNTAPGDTAVNCEITPPEATNPFGAP